MKTVEEVQEEAERLYTLILKGVDLDVSKLSEYQREYLRRRIEVLQSKVDVLNWVLENDIK